MIKKENERLTITLNPESAKILDHLCKMLKTKNKSKAIKFLLEFFDIEEMYKEILEENK